MKTVFFFDSDTSKLPDAISGTINPIANIYSNTHFITWGIFNCTELFKHYYHAVWRKNSTREWMNYRNIVEFVSISINLWPSAQCVCVRKCLYGLLWLKKSISISTVFSFRNKNNILYFGKTFVASNRTTRLYCRT